MKTKILLLALFISSIASAQIVNIPDAAFKNLLLNADTSFNITIVKTGGGEIIDVNNDDQIQLSEALTVTSISIQGGSPSGITSFAGIQSFQNLKTLLLSEAQLNGAVLDVSGMVMLETVDIQDNNFASLGFSGCIGLKNLYATGVTMPVGLNLSGLTSLINLQIFDTNIPSVNLTGCALLTNLQVELTDFTTINLTGCTGLKVIDGASGKLSSIDVGDCINLERLTLILNLPGMTAVTLGNHPNLHTISIEDNNISSIDIINCPALVNFSAMNNNFTSLDFSHNPVLAKLNVLNNNLQYLNLKNGATTYTQFNIGNNPLQYVCIDDGEESYLQPAITANPLLSVNTYCTFTPGGNYNTITGTLTFDMDGNGCGAGDYQSDNIKVKINDGTNNGYTFTNSLGQYTFFTQAGNYTLTPVFENNWFTTTPAAPAVNFANNSNNTATQNFCVAPNGVHVDVELAIAPVSAAQPGFDASYLVSYKNKGNQVADGGIFIYFPTSVMDYVSGIPAAGSGSADESTGSIVYEYPVLMPFESQSFVLNFNLNSPAEAPPLNNGDMLPFTTMMTPFAADENQSDNNRPMTQTVTGSFDPNDITCLEGATQPPSAIGKYLHYLVNFENTGTAATSFVVVKHDINPADYDINTVELLNASHPVTTRITDNRIEFIFENLALAAADHGNILFKLKSKSNLVAGDNVINSANIYFDYNLPVQTNDASTVFQVLSTGDFTQDDSVAVYPNPSRGLVTIKANSQIKSVELYDVQGRLLQSVSGSAGIDISQRAAGIYFMKVKTEKGVKVEKLIRQ